ncbi:MAG: ABC transporter permease, partial [candidate division WOR-3 bacterium]
MRSIANIITKEVRELLTPRLLAPFVAVLAVMLIVGKTIRGERAKARLPQRILVVLHDTTVPVRQLVARLNTTDLLCEFTSQPTESVLVAARNRLVSTVIVIPRGTGQRLSALDSTEIEVYSVLRSFSATQAMRTLKVKELLDRLNRYLADSLVLHAFPDRPAQNITNPLRLRQFTVIANRTAAGDPGAITGIIMSQMFMIPMVLLMIIIYVSQMIAASIGQEKENKTLETLLTVPISRLTIVAGKMLGAVVVALVTTAIFFVAFSYYGGAFQQLESVPGDGGGVSSMVSRLNLNLSAGSMILVAVTLLLGIVCALSLATLLAVFAEDARSAQAIIAPVMVLCLLPYFLAIFFDIETLSLPLRLLIYAIPFSYPFLAPRAVLFHEYGTIVRGCL